MEGLPGRKEQRMVRGRLVCVSVCEDIGVKMQAKSRADADALTGLQGRM